MRLQARRGLAYHSVGTVCQRETVNVRLQVQLTAMYTDVQNITFSRPRQDTEDVLHPSRFILGIYPGPQDSPQDAAQIAEGWLREDGVHFTVVRSEFIREVRIVCDVLLDLDGVEMLGAYALENLHIGGNVHIQYEMFELRES